MSNHSIKVLQILNSLGRGGIETMVTGLHQHIDPLKIKFDYAIMSGKATDYADIVRGLGGNIYIYPALTLKNFFDFMRWWRNFFRTDGRQYDIIHAHSFTTASLYLPLAKKAGAYTIVHSHSTNFSTKSKLKNVKLEYFIRKMLLRPYRSAKWIDARFACSAAAGNWLYGKSSSFRVINNGIDLKAFQFDEKIRTLYRKKLELENKFVIGHVGNATDAKNHLFLLKLFKEVLIRKPDAELLLIGNLTERITEIEAYIRENDLNDNVKILGVREDVPNLMMAMDMFAFPSKYEGLGMVLIEAQATGLPCVVSETIPEEAKIGENYIFCSLEETEEYWAEKIIQSEIKQNERIFAYKSIARAGYDIRQVAKEMQDIYIYQEKESNIT